MTPHVRDEALSTKVRALSDAVETGWTTSGPLSIIDTLKAQESFILDHCIIRDLEARLRSAAHSRTVRDVQISYVLPPSTASRRPRRESWSVHGSATT